MTERVGPGPAPKSSPWLPGASRSRRGVNKERFSKNGKTVDPIDKDFITLFKHLKVSDTLEKFETKNYKTINIKKQRDHQKDRKKKTESIAMFVESIYPSQTVEFLISDTSDKALFSNLGMICNTFYIPFYNDEAKNYFNALPQLNKEIKEKLKSLSNNCFLLNIGKYSGAERKSLNDIRWIKGVKESDKSKTTARTFALEEKASDTTFFDKELLPFGWVLCEYIGDTPKLVDNKIVEKEYKKEQEDKIDNYLQRVQASKIKKVYFLHKVADQLGFEKKSFDNLVIRLNIILNNNQIDPDDLVKLLEIFKKEK